MSSQPTNGYHKKSRICYLIPLTLLLFCMATGPCYCPPTPPPAKSCSNPGIISENIQYQGYLYVDSGTEYYKIIQHPSCVTDVRYYDVWKFTPSCDGWVDITLTTGSTDMYFYVSKACGDSNAVLKCNTNSIENLTKGTEYYVVVTADHLSAMEGYEPIYKHFYTLDYIFTCGEKP